MAGLRRLLAMALAAAGALPCAAAGDAALLAQGRALFNGGAKPACALCHTLKDAGSEGAVGPVLDELQPDAQRVAKALRDGVGAMPSFAATLSDEQIEALALYVSTVAGR
ncbi:MAG: cytochrome c [Pseudomonadota bacterium]